MSHASARPFGDGRGPPGSTSVRAAAFDGPRRSGRPGDAHRPPACDPGPRCADPQPPGHRPRPATRSPDRCHGGQRRGKSSLALDTLYAEGQRRYVETFSPYARQFLEKLDRPDADRIEGIPAAIAAGRSQGRHSGRSTVGTLAEVHDALAMLFAGVGEVICRVCGARVEPLTPTVVSHAIDALPEGTRYEIAFPMDLRPESDRDALLRTLNAEGFTRIASGGEIRRLDDPALTLPESGSVDVIVDRLVRGRDAIERRLDSIESAFAKGLGRCRLRIVEEVRTFLRGWRCSRCGTDHDEPRPDLFRFNRASAPARPAKGSDGSPTWTSTGSCPTPRRRSGRGRSCPGPRPPIATISIACSPMRRRWAIPVDVPFARLDPEQVRRVIEGVPDLRFGGLEGFFEALERKTYKLHVRAFLARWRRYRTCPACDGARLRPEALAVRIEGRNIAELFDDADPGRPDFPGRADRAEGASDRHATAGACRTAADVSGGHRPGLPDSGPTVAEPLGRRASAGRPDPGSRLGADEHALRPRRAHGGAASEGGRSAGDGAGALRDRGNTVLVVEHDAGLIAASDHAIDLGPGAGEAGGRVLYDGPTSGLASASGSPTSDYLAGRLRPKVPSNRRAGTGGRLELIGASGNNLRSIEVAFPLGVVCAVAGVSGAGKSTLIEETLYPALRRAIRGEAVEGCPYAELRGAKSIETVEFLDRSPLSRSGRSNPVTYPQGVRRDPQDLRRDP